MYRGRMHTCSGRVKGMVGLCWWVVKPQLPRHTARVSSGQQILGCPCWIQVDSPTSVCCEATKGELG